MEWVAVSTGIAKDPTVHRIAAALRVRVPEVVGLLTLTFAEMTTHAPDGALGDVPDSLLEAWSGWHGKRGIFAAQFRAHLCDPAGLVVAWEKYNGAAIRRADAARERARDYRQRQEQAKASANSTHTETRTSTQTPPVRERRTRQDTALLSTPNGVGREEPADDTGLAPAGAAPADVAATNGNRTGDYLRAPSNREALARAGYRPDPDAPPVPVTPLAEQAAELHERADRYRSLLESSVTEWQDDHPDESLALEHEEVARQGLRGRVLGIMATQALRQAVVETLRTRMGWPTLETWDGADTFTPAEVPAPC